MRQRLRHVAAAAPLLLLAAGCGSSARTSNAGPTVTIKQIAFHPSTLTAKAGQTVSWAFDDAGVQHTVTADDSSFDSGPRSSGSFTHVFGQAGTFKYHCSIHASMTGSIVVSA